jgi:hypothetical protein
VGEIIVSDAFQCSICQRICEPPEHDARPVNEGRCCEVCNWGIVMPARTTKAEVMRQPWALVQLLRQLEREQD